MIPPDTGPLGDFSKNVIHSPIRQLSQICCPVNQHSVLVKEINDYIYIVVTEAVQVVGWRCSKRDTIFSSGILAARIGYFDSPWRNWMCHQILGMNRGSQQCGRRGFGAKSLLREVDLGLNRLIWSGFLGTKGAQCPAGMDLVVLHNENRCFFIVSPPQAENFHVSTHSLQFGSFENFGG